MSRTPWLTIFLISHLPCVLTSLGVSFLTCEMGTGLLTFMATESHEAVLTKALLKL